MKIEILLLFPLYRADDEFIFDRINGIVFRREDPVFTFDSEVPRIVDIMIASPRLQFREAFQADCADIDEGLDMMPRNFFNIDGSLPDLQENLQRLSKTCSSAFNIFDAMIFSLVNDDLIPTEILNKTSSQPPLKKNRLRRDEPTAISRQRRAIGAVIAGGAAAVGAVAIVATAGYAISVDVKSKERDELLERKINEDRQRLASLTTVVELLDESIDEVAKMIRKSETPIITFAGIELGEDEKMREKMVDADPNTLNNFFASYSQRIGRETIRAIMLLSTQRMPLMAKFITAIRAQCLAIQDTENMDLARSFCLHFALHASRFDTSLRFAGLGFTKFNSTVDASPNGFRIKEIIISLEIKIPRLRLQAERYSVANLGYFKNDGSRWKLKMPLQLIVMPSREVLKMNPSLCLKFNPSYACSITSLEPSTCGESLLTSNNTRLCETYQADSDKCGYMETHDRAFISMAKESKVNFFHHHPSKQLLKIDTFTKEQYGGAIDCGATVIKVNAGFEIERVTTRINYIAPINIKVTNIEEHRYLQLENRTHLALKNNHNLKMTDEKLDIKISAVEAKVMDVIHRITGWISGLSSIVVALLVGLLLYKLRCCKREPTSRIMLANFQPPSTSSSRTDSSL